MKKTCNTKLKNIKKCTDKNIKKKMKEKKKENKTITSHFYKYFNDINL